MFQFDIGCCRCQMRRCHGGSACDLGCLALADPCTENVSSRCCKIKQGSVVGKIRANVRISVFIRLQRSDCDRPAAACRITSCGIGIFVSGCHTDSCAGFQSSRKSFIHQIGVIAFKSRQDLKSKTHVDNIGIMLYRIVNAKCDRCVRSRTSQVKYSHGHDLDLHRCCLGYDAGNVCAVSLVRIIVCIFA